MSDLNSIIKNGFEYYFEDFRSRTVRLATAIPEAHFWKRPYPYGNSMGNLVLHLTGNLAYYIGAVLEDSGYVRDREEEFSRSIDIPRDQLLRSFNQTVDLVVESLRHQTLEDWTEPYAAIGVDDVQDRFSIFLRCSVHFHHHIGQMIYLAKAINGETNE